MSRTSGRSCIAVVFISSALAGQAAGAEWGMSVVDLAGQSSQTVSVGEMFQLRIALSGDPTDWLSGFGMVVSTTGDAGVTFDDYLLNPRSFLTGGQNDFSDLSTLHFEFATIDFRTQFRVLPEDAGLATLVTLDLTATGPGTLAISPVVDFVANDLVGKGQAVTVGEPFVLTVVPEPATLALLGLCGVFAIRRRRKTA